MRKRNVVHSVLLLCCICLCTYCSKPPDTPVTPVTPPVTTPTAPPPVVPTPPGADFSVDGKWEFQLNGVPYSGTVDTSFVQLLNPSYSHPDTLIQCTGTSFDKKANVSFVININRGIFPGNTITTNLGKASFIFDTLSPYYFVSPGNFVLAYQIDSLNGQKLKCTFSGAVGQATNSTPVIHMVTNGKFSCEFGKGTNEPKKFLFNPDANIPYSGNFTRAKIFSNTLVMEGKTYISGAGNFKLLVRTGGTIKTGTYLSSNGDASLQDNGNFFITDSAGSLSVTITAVNNNIVEGVFFRKGRIRSPYFKRCLQVQVKRLYSAARRRRQMGIWSCRL